MAPPLAAKLIKRGGSRKQQKELDDMLCYATDYWLAAACLWPLRMWRYRRTL